MIALVEGARGLFRRTLDAEKKPRPAHTEVSFADFLSAATQRKTTIASVDILHIPNQAGGESAQPTEPTESIVFGFMALTPDGAILYQQIQPDAHSALLFDPDTTDPEIIANRQRINALAIMDAYKMLRRLRGSAEGIKIGVHKDGLEIPEGEIMQMLSDEGEVASRPAELVSQRVNPRFLTPRQKTDYS